MKTHFGGLCLSVATLVLIATLSWAQPVRAECLVAFEPDAILQAIETADSCQTAIQISRTCAFGSSFDQQSTARAGERCLMEIEPLYPGDRRALARLQRACTEKYAGQQGSLFLSFAAFCRLQAIEAFHAALTPLEMSDFGE